MMIGWVASKTPWLLMTARPRESLGLQMTNLRRWDTPQGDPYGKCAQKGWSPLEVEAEMSIEGYKDEKNTPRS